MRRRRSHNSEEEHDNHDRWLVSYADFITLLFAFFVVMYGLSQVNEAKYKVLASALKAAFHVAPGATEGLPDAVVPGDLLAPPTAQKELQDKRKMRSQPGAVAPKTQEEIKKEEMRRRDMERMRSMAREILAALAPLVKGGQVRVTEGPIGITVEINASVLFEPGEVRPGADAVRSLSAIAHILGPSEFPIIVEGHTDNIPISTAQFPSNWELSGMRASSVVRLFINNGVAGNRLSAVGYADQRPIADNGSPEGRARNRRVAIIIEARTPNVLSEVPVLPEAGQSAH